MPASVGNADMEKEEKLLKKNMKICLPGYKIAYSIVFMIVLAFVRGISQTSEIGIAIVPNIALLSIVFCADTYEIEFREKRWEIFTLLPRNSRVKAIWQRMLIQICFLCFAAYAGYGIFYWQRPVNDPQQSSVVLYLMYMAAVTAVISFWGMISMTLVNLTGKLWTGIGIAVIIWIQLNSKTGDTILGKYNIFSFSFRDTQNISDLSWLAGFAAALLLTAVMFVSVPYIIKKRGNRYER